MREIYVGQRVYHRRADGFAEVKEVSGETAKVKYEWPWDPAASPVEVPLSELVYAWEAPGEG